MNTEPCPKCRGTGKIPEPSVWPIFAYFVFLSIACGLAGGYGLWVHNLFIAVPFFLATVGAAGLTGLALWAETPE